MTLGTRDFGRPALRLALERRPAGGTAADNRSQ